MVIRARTERCVSVACALTLTCTLEARADAPRPALVVTRAQGAEDCPDAAGLATRMSGMSLGNPFETSPEVPRDTWVQVEFSQALSGYRAVISARGRRQGTRSIEDVGPGCASLADAVAITLVMLLDPELGRPSPLPTPRPTALPLVPDESTPRPAPEPGVRFGVDAGGGATLAVLEHAAPYVEGGLTLRVGSWLAFGLGGGYVFPDHAVIPSGSVELDLWYAYARASARVFEHEGTRVLLFAGPSTGSLGGQGVDYAQNPEARRWWIAGAFGGELHAALSHSSWWTARLMLLVPFRHAEFYVLDGGVRQTAFETPAVGGALALGVLVEP